MTLEQIQALSDDEIRVRVAEMAGWTSVRMAFDANTISRPWGKSPQCVMNWCPNYPADLNACQDFERDLADPHDYRDTLAEVCVDAWKDGNHWIPCPEFATARQRCEAFLAVMQVGKGEGNP